MSNVCIRILEMVLVLVQAHLVTLNLLADDDV